MRILLIVLTLINLWYVNNRVLIIEPSTYEAKRPSEWLKDPNIRYLMKQKGDFKVSGLDFPFYCGHWVHLKTLGYMGGFRDKKLSVYLGGIDGTNTWNRTLAEAREYGIRYFLKGEKLYELAETDNLREILVAEDDELRLHR